MVEMEVTAQNDAKVKFENVKLFAYNGLANGQLNITSATEAFGGNDEGVKAAFDHTFRVYVMDNITTIGIEEIKKVLDLAVLSAQKKMCLVTTPIFIINDLLSTLTIQRCSEVFCYLEDNSHVWKSEIFYSSVKNSLLRMCNDLLKRLSKSQSTVFSGRIHLFLAKLFPLNEKSGLNLMSHFSDNFTRYTTAADAFEAAINKNKCDNMDTDNNTLMATHSMPIDYNLYTHFWSLQEFFSKPNSCFDKTAWRTFVSNSDQVLEALKSYRLDDVKDSNSSLSTDDEQNYFAKYLTSEKLLDLQLNDFNFRRQTLIQFLILFQYLNAEVKFKTSTQSLTEDQNSWCRGAIKKVHDLLKETPPNGSKFNTSVKHILEREEIWNKWKNEGCPNYVKELQEPKKMPVKRPRPTTSDFVADSGKKFSFDQTDMTKLCNINHGNLEACKDPERQFLPSLREFFDEAIEQLDPVNQVEKQYYLSNQTDWAWKALRLLSKRSSYYFMQNQNVKTISEYLEAICLKLNKEFMSEAQKQQQLQQQQMKEEQHQKQIESAVNSPAEPQENEDLEQLDDDQNGNASLNEQRSEAVQNEVDDSQDIQEEMNTSAKNDLETVNSPVDASPAKNTDFEMTHSPAPVTEKKSLLDMELIEVIVESIETVTEWKTMAASLKMDEDTVSFIENENSDVKEQCRKILRLWKEREEKKAFPEIIQQAIVDSNMTELAQKFEAKLGEWSA